MIRKIVQNFGVLSVSKYQEGLKLRWTRRKKIIFYASFGFIGLELYTQIAYTQIYFTFLPTQRNIDIINNNPTLKKGCYKPTYYLVNAFLMALYGSKFDPIPYMPYERSIINLGDGELTTDQLPYEHKYIDDTEGEEKNARVLIILHGLTVYYLKQQNKGASETNYIRQAALCAQRKKFRTFCINMRGYSNSKMVTPIPNDFSQLKDLEIAVDWIKNKCPNSKIYMMGFSMGGLQMVNYLKTHNDIAAGVGISVPWDLQYLSQIISKPHKFIYNLAITKNFQRNLQWNLDTYKQAKDIDIDNALKCTDIKMFDDLVTRRLLKYDNIDQMYSQIKCTNNLDKIQCPLLLISSKNDPIIDQDVIPKSEILKNENIILVQTQKGGHIEWFQGARNPQRWVNKPSMCFLDYIDKNI